MGDFKDIPRPTVSPEEDRAADFGDQLLRDCPDVDQVRIFIRTSDGAESGVECTRDGAGFGPPYLTNLDFGPEREP